MDTMSTPGFRFECHHGRFGFETLRPRWQHLADRMEHGSHLHQPGWIAAWLATLARRDRDLMFVSASLGRELCAVLVLRRRHDPASWVMPQWEMVHGPHMILADMACTRTRLPGLWPALRRWLNGPQGPSWLALHLPMVTADAELAHCPGLTDTSDPLLLRTERGHSAWLDCSGSSEQALQQVSRSFHQNLRRLRRRAEAAGRLDYRVVTDPAALHEALDRFLQVEGSGWKASTGTAIVQDPALVAFYRRLIDEFGPRGRCRIFLLDLDGQTVAAQFGLLGQRQLGLLKIGYSNAHRQIAPGNLIMRETIEHACADPGVDRLSFITHPHWSHLWKPNLTPVSYLTLYRDNALGHLAASLARRRRSTPDTAAPLGVEDAAEQPADTGFVAAGHAAG